MNRKRGGLYSIIGGVVLCSLLLTSTSSTYAFTLQTTPMISASKLSTFTRRNSSGNARLFISLSSPKSDESEEKVIREPSATISLSKDIKSSSNNVEVEEDVNNCNDSKKKSLATLYKHMANKMATTEINIYEYTRCNFT